MNIENLISDFINTLTDKPKTEKRQGKMRHDHLYKDFFYIKVGLEGKERSPSLPKTSYGSLFAITLSAYNDTSAQPQISQWGQPVEIPVEVKCL